MLLRITFNDFFAFFTTIHDSHTAASSFGVQQVCERCHLRGASHVPKVGTMKPGNAADSDPEVFDHECCMPMHFPTNHEDIIFFIRQTSVKIEIKKENTTALNLR